MHYQILYSSATLGLIWIGLILYSMISLFKYMRKIVFLVEEPTQKNKNHSSVFKLNKTSSWNARIFSKNTKHISRYETFLFWANRSDLLLHLRTVFHCCRNQERRSSLDYRKHRLDLCLCPLAVTSTVTKEFLVVINATSCF